MKVLPVFLYFLRNSPIWVPSSFFKRVNCLFGSFLWSTAHPRISLHTLQEPLGQGGLALPGLFKYFIAGQMVARRLLLYVIRGMQQMCLEAACVGSYESLFFDIQGHPSIAIFGSMCVTVHAWDRAQVMMKSGMGIWSPDTPLWFNPRLPHLGMIPDPIIWAWVDIKQLKHIVEGSKLLTFNQKKGQTRAA